MGRKHSHSTPRRIACLACAETRVVHGVEAGECPRCHYVGWMPADDLDGPTRRSIMNGAFAGRHRHIELKR